MNAMLKYYNQLHVICLQDDILTVKICRCVFDICLQCITQLLNDICPHCKRRYNIASTTDNDDYKEYELASVILEKCNINMSISVFMGKSYRFTFYCNKT